MRRVSIWNWQRGAYRAAAIAAFAALVGFAPTTARAACVGDCNGDKEVTVDEIITMVNISLELAPLSGCTAGDGNNDGAITVDEIIQAVNNSLTSCPIDTMPVCGNAVKDTGEDCDDGGLCVGGGNAGAICDQESDCNGNGVCAGGLGSGKSCASDGDCPGSKCIHCRTFGGDGCAANCTSETTVPYNLVPGVVEGLSIKPGTSGAVVNGDPLTIPLPITGSQSLVVGKLKDGAIPFVIPAASVQFPQIAVSTLACACVRGVPFKTCGGTIFDADGVTLTPSCTDGFNGGVTCPAEHPCAFVHGPGNSASGELACGSGGLQGVNVTLTQDAGGPDQEPGPVQIELSASGPAGSARLLNSTAIGTAVGRCTASYCTDNDPPASRGTPQTLPFTTGQACATVLQANDDPTFNIGPLCSTGAPANCSNVGASPPVITGLATAGAFPAVGQPTVGDIVVTNNFVAQ